jgi:hypothetical protein
LWINHVGNCIRTKSRFVDWSSDNYKGQNKKSAPTVIIEDLELIKGGFTHREREVSPASETLSHMPVLYI